MKTQTRKEAMYERITKHGENLKRIFKLDPATDPVKLCNSLRRLEAKAHHATTCLSNTNTLHLLELNRFTGYDVEQATEAEQDAFFDKILSSLSKIIGKENMSKVFIDLYPGGYALKIREEYASNGLNVYKDWGGYGIIAPDLTND